MTTQGIRALGYEYNFASGNITAVRKTLPEAQNLGGMLLLAEPISSTGNTREVNPCGITWVYGGGSSGGNGSGSGNGSGGGSSNNVDDDGAQKNGFSGGLVTPTPGIDAWGCAQSGVRATQLHLARRGEGGLFGGKSEVYIDVTIYQSSDPVGTWKTNDGSQKQELLTINAVPFFVNVGKQLAQVPQSVIGTSNPITAVTPVNPYLPNNSSDWVIMEEGFCDAQFSPGYDRMFIRMFENDPALQNANRQFLMAILTQPGILYEGHQYAEMTLPSDVFFAVEITPSMFSSSGILYLSGANGVFGASTSMPPASSSWIQLELY
jgi:hypothetical protein